MNNSVERKYKQPMDAINEVQSAFDDWCSILTSHSVQASYAIIGANWIVRRSAEAILANCWSKWSIIIVMLFLALNLVTTYIMTLMHGKRLDYAEDNPEKWNSEFNRRPKYWPYTKSIDELGFFVRFCKCALPFTAALFFVVSLFRGVST